MYIWYIIERGGTKKALSPASSGLLSLKEDEQQQARPPHTQRVHDDTCAHHRSFASGTSDSGSISHLVSHGVHSQTEGTSGQPSPSPPSPPTISAQKARVTRRTIRPPILEQRFCHPLGRPIHPALSAPNSQSFQRPRPVRDHQLTVQTILGQMRPGTFDSALPERLGLIRGMQRVYSVRGWVVLDVLA